MGKEFVFGYTCPSPASPPRVYISTESNLTTHRTHVPNNIKLIHLRIDMLKQDLSKLKQLIDRVRVRLGSKVGYEQKFAYPMRNMLFGDHCLACIGKERCDWIYFYFCCMSHAKINEQIQLDQLNLYLLERVYWKQIWMHNDVEPVPIWNT